MSVPAWIAIACLGAAGQRAAADPPPAHSPGPTATGSAAVASPAAPAAARPIEVTPIARERWPAGVTARGATLERAVTFRDAIGTHYVVLSSTDTTTPQRGDLGPIRARTLYVDDWVVGASGKPRSTLPVRDMITDCSMGDLSVKFHDGALQVTDLDRDGIAEIAFGYELSCRSDVSPAVYKLLVIENGSKYILRGRTRIRGDGDATEGGAFTPDPPAQRWPRPFLDHATALWNRTADDLDVPPVH